MLQRQNSGNAKRVLARKGSAAALAVASVLFIAHPPSALADDGFLGAVGHGVVPLENDHVAMDSEHVDAVIRDDGAWVTCVFTFTNSGPAAHVLMGFPEARSRRSLSSDTAPTELLDFQAFVDGLEFEVQYLPQVVPTRTPIATLTVQQMRQYPRPTWTPRPANPTAKPTETARSSTKFSGWHTFTVPFESGQTRVVRNTYHGALSGISIGVQMFSYVVESGSSWSGPIGQADIVVRWEDDRVVAPGWVHADPPSFETSDRRLTWRFTDFEPGSDHNVLVSFVSAGTLEGEWPPGLAGAAEKFFGLGAAATHLPVTAEPSPNATSTLAPVATASQSPVAPTGREGGCPGVAALVMAVAAVAMLGIPFGRR